MTQHAGNNFCRWLSPREIILPMTQFVANNFYGRLSHREKFHKFASLLHCMLSAPKTIFAYGGVFAKQFLLMAAC
jgi:hypothetical protein